jgi:hypothetical protein
MRGRGKKRKSVKAPRRAKAPHFRPGRERHAEQDWGHPE